MVMPISACHDELVVECPEEQAEEVAHSLAERMVTGMDEVLNPDLDASEPDRVLVEVEVKILGTWTGKCCPRTQQSRLSVSSAGPKPLYPSWSDRRPRMRPTPKTSSPTASTTPAT